MRFLKKVLRFLIYRGFFDLLSDRLFLYILYYAHLGKKLNLKNPKTFNEKLQWLKLYNRKAEYTQMVDKYEVKKYIKERLGEEYIVPTIGVWDKFEEIEFKDFPEQFVLKCTHSGGIIICKDKSEFNLEEARRKINDSMRKNYFLHGREWPYKNVRPRILAEEFVPNSNDEQGEDSLVVYKVFCFGGEPKLIQVIQNDKRKDESIDYFDIDWKLLELKQNFPNSKIHLNKPDKFSEMLDLSSELSKGTPFLRVDWYVSMGKLLFSEFTYYSDAGIAAFEPEEWDRKLGEWIELS